MEEIRVGKKGIWERRGDGKLYNPRMGRKLFEYRKQAGMTQDDLAHRFVIHHPELHISNNQDRTLENQARARNYIGGMEQGRICVPSPLQFNPFHEELGFPGWELLDLMGYDTDGDAEDPVIPSLRSVAKKLTESQQNTLARIGRDLLAQSEA